ncbi:MAG: transglutaminase domain-containing protein [Anaerovoracaceae bacterium]|jgi:hypothetical protein
MKTKIITAALTLFLIFSVGASAEDTDSGGTIPSEADSSALNAEGEVEYRAANGYEEELPAPTITGITTKPGRLTAAWTGEGDSYLVTLYEKDGKTLEFSVTEKNSRSFSGLNPGESYLIGVIARKEGRQSEETRAEGTVSSKVNIKLFRSNKKAADDLYLGIRRKEKHITLYFPSSGHVSGEKLLSLALPEKRMGDYYRSQMDYSIRKRSTRHHQYGKEPIRINGVPCTKYTFRFRYYTTKAQEKRLNRKLSRVTRRLRLSGCSRAEKLRRIVSYLDRHAKQRGRYHPMNKTAYGALIYGKTNCRGRSVLFYRMCRKAGIPCRIAYGAVHVRSQSPRDADPAHLLNLVRYHEKYYFLDTLYDEGLTGRGKLKGRFRLLDPTKRLYRTLRVSRKNRDIGLVPRSERR